MKQVVRWSLAPLSKDFSSPFRQIIVDHQTIATCALADLKCTRVSELMMRVPRYSFLLSF